MDDTKTTDDDTKTTTATKTARRKASESRQYVTLPRLLHHVTGFAADHNVSDDATVADLKDALRQAIVDEQLAKL